jgi:predicted esterase
LESNQRGLDSALRRIASLLDALEARGFPVERILLAGFSQGACLALEYVCRDARRYGGVVGFSGGLIGPNGLERGYDGSLERTSILLGCSDVDPYIPLARVRHTEQIMMALGADVDLQVYPGWGHAVHSDGIGRMREMLCAMVPET